MKKVLQAMDGNQAAAWSSYAFTEVAGIYPITPGKPIYTNNKPMVNNIRILGKKVDFTKYGNMITYDEIMKEIEE